MTTQGSTKEKFAIHGPIDPRELIRGVQPSINLDNPDSHSIPMPRLPTEDPIPDQMLSELSLFLEFDDLSSRYLNTQNLAYQKISDEAVPEYAAEMFQRKTMLEALRLGTSWFLEMLDLSRGRDWYNADRERLSRHVVLLALFPESFDTETVHAGGQMAKALLAERKAISADYLHLYDPRSWGEVPTEGDDLPDLLDDMDWMEQDQAGMDDDDFADHKDKMTQLELLFENVWEAYPGYLEESVAIQNEIDKVFQDISGEWTGQQNDAAVLFQERRPESMSVLHRFVIESLIFRFMLEEGAEQTLERGERWIKAMGSEDSPLKPFSTADVKRSMALLDGLYGDPETSNDLMIGAAQNVADLGDHGSSWNMTESVLERTDGTDVWPAIALEGVMNLRSSDKGMAEQLSRRILDKGEKEKDRSLIAAGLIAMTLSLHSLGQVKESEAYQKRMMDAMLSGIDQPQILFLYPAAAWGCLGIGAKQEARRLSSTGLRYIPEEMGGEIRGELLQVRRQADQVERKKKDVPISGPRRH